MIRFREAPVPALFPVTIVERAGRITFYIDPSLTLPEVIAAMNAAVREQLAEGGLVQLHNGEIFTLGLAQLVQQATSQR
ncbi:hypothetical protein ABZ135_12525 [Streptomyces sp. NPDC006339]|uniref:hypothetical protein n=1 Tax=Streptomyces sp. NPDC006339 TaxID=3156755 RepID=UPI0033BFB6A2